MIEDNLFQNIPNELKEEKFLELLSNRNIRIERILSKGHTSPDSGWYDQEENEWVIVLDGSGIIEFENGKEVKLSKGDYLNIPKHTKHKVKWTEPDKITIWLAVFYQ